MATARESMLLSVRWNKKLILDPILYRFDVSWLRRITVRELLLHVLQESSPINHARIDNSDEISLFVVQHIDECSIDGTKKVVKINAIKMLDEEVYVVIEDVPTRQFDFVFSLSFICIHLCQNIDLFLFNDFAGTLRNKHWKMPWGQTFFCVVCNPLLKDALAMIFFSAIPNFHVLRRLIRIFMLAKDR
jgi:hypothetical protein